MKKKRTNQIWKFKKKMVGVIENEIVLTIQM